MGIRYGASAQHMNAHPINFDLYQGKTLEGNNEFVKVVDKCSSAVLQLLKKLLSDKKNFPVFLYFDSLFRVGLLTEYRVGLCTATIRDNRLRMSS